MRGLVLPALLVLGCHEPEPARSTAGPDAPPEPLVTRGRFKLPQEDLRGASGLDRGPDGRFWSVLERGRRAYPFRIDRGGVRLEPGIPITGVVDGLDLEATAWVDEETVALGTESRDPQRTGDVILFARPAVRHWDIIERRLFFPYADLGLRPARNRGIEGLCSAAGRLVATSEVVGTAGKRRFAPLVVFSPHRNAPVGYRLMLTTATGKISGLACRARPPANHHGAPVLEGFAIERHFGVLRVLRFLLPPVPPAQAGMPGARKGFHADVEPERLWDLGAALGDPFPNFEGLALARKADILILVSDNDYGGVTGPTEVLWVKLRGAGRTAVRPDRR